jgi:hypothetical protein
MISRHGFSPLLAGAGSHKAAPNRYFIKVSGYQTKRQKPKTRVMPATALSQPTAPVKQPPTGGYEKVLGIYQRYAEQLGDMSTL